ncbi:MAG: protein-disulfide reductase DsbD domain-containing protein, partial [Isosphaeraceae bacterium]
LKPGWHAYANPTGIEGLPPTRLSLDPDQPAALLELTYPKGVSKVLAANGAEAVALYEGEVPLRAKVRIDPAAKPGALTLKFTVAYQACDDRACLAPARLSVDVPIRVSP